MINSIYVPVIINGESELFEVNVCENNFSDSSVIMEDEIFPRYEKLFKNKIPKVNCNIGFDSVDDGKILNDFSNTTYSITLGAFIAAKIFTYKPVLKNIYTGIIITGNLAEGNDYLCVVTDIEEKFNSVTKLLKTKDDNVLFIYVSDEEYDLKKSESITVKRFSSYDTLDKIYNFLFASKNIDINYNPIEDGNFKQSYTISNKTKKVMHNLICEQMENRSLDIDMQSITLNINLDRKMFPQNYEPRISQVYDMIGKKNRLLRNCIQLLFSKDVKKLYSSLNVDYEIVLKKLFDLILANKTNEPRGYILIDVVKKTGKGDLVYPFPIAIEDWDKVLEENYFRLGKELGKRVIVEKMSKREPLFPLIEIQILFGSNWNSQCFLPTLLLNLAIDIEKEVLKSDEINEDTFNGDKWLVMGEH